MPAKEAKNSKPRIFSTRVKSSDVMETTNISEVHHDKVGTLPELKHSHESCTAKFNSGEYKIIIRKELTE
ncbi:hypothetical protein ACP70R_030248 [Stipagrostis hirtigluma subsp. patula]